MRDARVFIKALTYVCVEHYTSPNYNAKQPILIEQDCEGATAFAHNPVADKELMATGIKIDILRTN